MERTETRVVLARMMQFHPSLRDKVYDINIKEQTVRLLFIYYAQI